MKYKLTFALVAALTSTAFAAFQAPLPEFKNEKKLIKWRAEKASEATSQGYASEETAFYTGKPYLASSGGYAFKYRSYDPELARWTSEDPSGFPDGANSNSYINNKITTDLDFEGLKATGVFASQVHTISLTVLVYANANSDPNNLITNGIITGHEAKTPEWKSTVMACEASQATKRDANAVIYANSNKTHLFE